MLTKHIGGAVVDPICFGDEDEDKKLATGSLNSENLPSTTEMMVAAVLLTNFGDHPRSADDNTTDLGAHHDETAEHSGNDSSTLL